MFMQGLGEPLLHSCNCLWPEALLQYSCCKNLACAVRRALHAYACVAHTCGRHANQKDGCTARLDQQRFHYILPNQATQCLKDEIMQLPLPSPMQLAHIQRRFESPSETLEMGKKTVNIRKVVFLDMRETIGTQFY